MFERVGEKNSYRRATRHCICPPEAVAVLGPLGLGVAGFWQQAPDPNAALQQTRDRLLADLDRMPRYTCVQTITRSYYDARSGIRTPSCPGLIAIHNVREHMPSAFGWDRLRLEVAWVEGNNLHAWF